ncbi:hypothetical protein GGQ26_13300 [Aeromicrobium sp. zg-629]|uniref:beta strand repeat-containing protein n=1 Tax=Aeromicrobium senzhongii TaxID=2663859 RepID=UPI0012B5FF88|nr:hypothetical protein [Aeromicrobium senzhongii]MTB89330.1 hypothetical protein [Aeromicrobium senzhongii]
MTVSPADAPATALEAEPTAKPTDSPNTTEPEPATATDSPSKADQALPAATRAGLSFLGWTRADGLVEGDTDLGDGSTDGRAVPSDLAPASSVSSATALATALTSCTDATVRLAADIVSPALTVNCDVTLDLSGHELDVAGVMINRGKTFTIDDTTEGGVLSTSPENIMAAGIQTPGATLVIDGGTVEATTGNNSYAAAIGGGYNQSGGTVTINGGTVDATTGTDSSGAAIGGGNSGAAGTITINGGTVDATTGTDSYGAAIGGGNSGAAGTITINGGTVDARTNGTAVAIGATPGGVSSGAIVITGGTVKARGFGEAGAIGSHRNSTPLPIEIGTDAHVTAIGGATAATAVGHTGTPVPATPLAITIDGTLAVPTGALNTSGLDITIGATGQLIGSDDTPTTGASLTGTGTITNNGVIALTDVANAIDITGHHYTVTASTGTVTVYGPTVQAGHRTLPATPTRGADSFAGWTHADAPFTNTTPLPGTSTTGDPVTIELTPTWTTGTAAFDRTTITITAGRPTTVDLTLTNGDGDLVSIDPDDWTIDIPAGVALTHDDSTWVLTGTTAGTGTITATTTIDGHSYTATLDFTVEPGPVAAITLDLTGTAAQGETITLTATGTDRFGNDLGDVTGDVTFTSSIASDVIDGDQVSFTEAGTRIVTATHSNGTTATLAINVAVVLDEVVTLDLASTGTPAQGETITLTATGTDRFNNDLGDVTGDVTFTSSIASDVIDGDEVSFTKAGKRTITATHTNGTVATLLVDVAVVLGEVDGMEVGFTGAARQGDTIVVTVTGTDRFGNALGDVTDDVTFTSSVPTDVIAGNRITFPHASPHTITATHTDGATSTLLIEVEPLPVAVDEPTDHADDSEATAKQAQDDAALAETGSTATAWWFACGLALLLAGVGTTRRARRR